MDINVFVNLPSLKAFSLFLFFVFSFCSRFLKISSCTTMFFNLPQIIFHDALSQSLSIFIYFLFLFIFYLITNFCFIKLFLSSISFSASLCIYLSPSFYSLSLFFFSKISVSLRLLTSLALDLMSVSLSFQTTAFRIFSWLCYLFSFFFFFNIFIKYLSKTNNSLLHLFSPFYIFVYMILKITF